MKIAVVWFTCENDNGLVRVSKKSLERLGDFSFFVAVDKEDHWKPIDGVQAVRTTFERGGNLNGLECVSGQIEVMADIAETTGADYVLKIDSDVVAIGSRWLEMLDPARWALVGGYRNFYYQEGVWGGAYAIAGNALLALPKDFPALIQEANHFTYGNLGPRFPEDETITAIFRSAYPDNVLLDKGGWPESGWINRYEYKSSGGTYWRNFDFVEFGGCQWQLDGGEWNSRDRKRAIEETMEAALVRGNKAKLPQPIVGRSKRKWWAVWDQTGFWKYFQPVIREAARTGRHVHYLSDRDLTKDLESLLGNCEVLFLWNGTGWQYEQLLKACRAVGVRVLFCENGFAPQTDFHLIYTEGINATSSIMKNDLSWLTEEHIHKYHCYASHYAPKFIGGDEVLVPLQLESDFNIKEHSPISDMQQFIDYCCNVFSGEKIVFKRHPRDAKQYDTHGHRLVTSGDLLEMASRSKRVYGINSTCLLEASMIEGLDVTGIGNGFLSKKEPREQVLAALFALQLPIMGLEDMPDFLADDFLDLR
ncbi:MAG: hypothetical protein AAF514_12965 [Verrucomicrobiota bacterium]